MKNVVNTKRIGFDAAVRALEYNERTHRVGFIYGPPRSGKTAAAIDYAQLGDAIYIKATPSSTSCTVLREVVAGLHQTPEYKQQAVHRQAVALLSLAPHHAVVVDNGEFIRSEGVIDTLRALSAESGVPILIMRTTEEVPS